MSSSFYGIKSRYNNAVRRYELLKVATSYENSKICNTDLAVISNITVLLKQIENFQGMIKNANVVCENKEFSNTASDLTNLSNDVQKMLDDYTQINADIYNCSQLAFEKMMDEYNNYKADYESKKGSCAKCIEFLEDYYKNYDKDTATYAERVEIEEKLTDFERATKGIIKDVEQIEILLSNGLEYQQSLFAGAASGAISGAQSLFTAVSEPKSI